MAKANSADGGLPPEESGRKRVVVEYVGPQVDGGQFPVKRVVGEEVAVTAHIFSDGHDKMRAELLYRAEGDTAYNARQMCHTVNDEWEGVFEVSELETYYYTVRAWLDRFGTWREDLGKKVGAGHKVDVDLIIGAELLEEMSGRAVGEDTA